MHLGASLLPRGFGQLSNRDVHSNRLAFVSYVTSLDKLYVHDLVSSVRLPLLKERLAILYNGDKKACQNCVVDSSLVPIGCGAVAYHKQSESYMRVEVIASGAQQFEVAPIDMPELGFFIVDKKDVYKVPKSLEFPPQAFFVRMTRSSYGQLSYYLSSMARCVLHNKTMVVLNSEPKFGLVKITSASCPKGVLSKIGFIALGQSKFEGASTVQITGGGFGGKAKRVEVPELEEIEKFAETYMPKKEVKRKGSVSMKI